MFSSYIAYFSSIVYLNSILFLHSQINNRWGGVPAVPLLTRGTVMFLLACSDMTLV